MAPGVDYCGLEKIIHKGFCIATLEKLMKYWPGRSYIIMKSTPRVPGYQPLMVIGYKNNSRKVLGFIATEGDGSTELGNPYLSRFPDMHYNVSIRPVVSPCLIDRYFNACNEIENQNGMRQSEIVLDKYWVTQSGYFRLETTVALGMGITYGKLPFCHVIS